MKRRHRCIVDFFADIDGEECIGEVLEVEDGFVTCLEVSVLNEDGTHGRQIEPIPEWLEARAQEVYQDYIEQDW